MTTRTTPAVLPATELDPGWQAGGGLPQTRADFIAEAAALAVLLVALGAGLVLAMLPA
jgi:hypothetical protein